eukprot:CAMPEP_0170612540 /NCGR_PEP_ID=MMETSP0224-20130122/23779_1 /TAXON_ID=285029 /ORGANISM="Togula jolla, Strain CCCM 725" /LENGTH=82 /DNA_ID=CAMNT_0010938053 /DNA_START=59 /DNA_END=307 /DNA_ORIENTATION=+
MGDKLWVLLHVWESGPLRVIIAHGFLDIVAAAFMWIETLTEGAEAAFQLPAVVFEDILTELRHVVKVEVLDAGKKLPHSIEG